MSFFQDVHAALDTRLNALAGGTTIAWENTGHVPVKGTEYIRPTLLMAPSSLLDMDDLQMNVGIYQIDLFYPLGVGAGALLTKADAIYDHFKADLTLVSNGVTVYIKEISRTTSARRKKPGSWLVSKLTLNVITINRR